MNSFEKNSVVIRSATGKRKKQHQGASSPVALYADIDRQSTDTLELSVTKKSKKQHKDAPAKRASLTEPSEATCSSSFETDDMSLATPHNEKARLVSINEAFESLRLGIPTFPYERRLSKIDTLHLAISYINLLDLVIESNMTLYEYFRTSINDMLQARRAHQHRYGHAAMAKSTMQSFMPVWATSG